MRETSLIQEPTTATIHIQAQHDLALVLPNKSQIMSEIFLRYEFKIMREETKN